jgi:uncharacterized protein DUF3667
MRTEHCLNCGAPAMADARFCPRCGQRTDTARLTLGDIVRDLMHSFVNVERGPLAFAWALLTRPGGVALEYIEGRRRRHYGPFATLAVLVGVTALAINLSGFRVLSNDGLPPGPTELLERHFNVLLLVQLPLIGGTCALLFHHARRTWAEHMVLAAYTLSVRAVVLAVIGPASSLLAFGAPGPVSTNLFWVAWYAYFGWAASQFYPGARASSWLRGAAAAALAHVAIVGMLPGVSALYLAWVERT